MGRQQASKIYKTKRYTKEKDRILQEDLKSKATIHSLKNQSFDEYLPGLGQHYCIPCAKYFETDKALNTHTKSKVHKREIKNIKFGPYTPEEAASGAGHNVEKFLVKKQELESLINGNPELSSIKKDKHLKRRPGVAMDIDNEEEIVEEAEDAQNEITV